MRTALTAACLALALAPAAQATDDHAALQTDLDAHILPWSGDLLILSAVSDQIAATAGLTAEEIDARDLAWRAEIGTSDRPTITPGLTGPVADFLRDHLANSGGAITGIFVMDARGLNVAASDVTSDYWPGDEGRHRQTYGMGAGAVHFGDVACDGSSQKYQAQISFSLSDPASGEAFGAMTVGVNANNLM